MMGRIVYEVAQLVSDTATDKLAASVEQGEDIKLHLRGSLVLALIATEVENGTSKEELVAYLERIYDVINNPSIAPPPSSRN